MTIEREADGRRLRNSLIISSILWALFLPLLAILKFEGASVPLDTMNPLYIELTIPERQSELTKNLPLPPEPLPPKPADIAKTNSNENSSKTASAPASAPKVSQAPSEDRLPSPALRADPGSVPLSTARKTSSSSYQGADSLAPLTEDGLKGENLAAPVPRAAPASRAAAARASTSAAENQVDAFDQAARNLPGLASQGSVPANRSSSSATSSSTASGSALPSGTGQSSIPSGSSDVKGSFDFGAGNTRELWSPRRIRVPDKLLAGKPNEISTRVSFVIEGGGTVLASTISFDPPLPSDLDAFLRLAFSAWLFSPADSDGQVLFRYSIRVR
ncbi:hypothetical protein MASR2M78_09390 [Treponema sp.]